MGSGSCQRTTRVQAMLDRSNTLFLGSDIEQDLTAVFLQASRRALLASMVQTQHPRRCSFPCRNDTCIFPCRCIHVQVSAHYISLLCLKPCVETAFDIFYSRHHRPLSAFWTPLATYPHTCINEGVFMFSFSIITIILDFLILLLPLPVVWSLQLPKKQRIAVASLFFLGVIVCISGIIQAVYIKQALVDSYDETWVRWPLWAASAVEVDVGIVSFLCSSYNPAL